jgi:type IV pilus assembly protein PilC
LTAHGRRDREGAQGLHPFLAIEQVNIFPPMFSSMVSVGEESGSLDDILYKTAAFYDDEADAAISIMVASIEPVMIVLLGIFVGFIILSVILP